MSKSVSAGHDSGDRPPAGGRRKVRLIFAIVAGVIALQTLVVYRVSEPYPAIMMPGFGGTLRGGDGSVQVETVEILARFDDLSERPVGLDQLLADAPESMRLSIARWMFEPPREIPRPETSPLRNFVKEKIFPIMSIHNKKYYDKYIDPETVAWASRRLRILRPGSRPRSLRFDWYRDRYRFEGGRLSRERDLTGTFTMELDHEHPGRL